MSAAKGIWIDSPGQWVGFFGIAWQDTFVPLTFEEPELSKRVDIMRLAYPKAALVEAREAPNELQWNEAEWAKRKERAVGHERKAGGDYHRADNCVAGEKPFVFSVRVQCVPLGKSQPECIGVLNSSGEVVAWLTDTQVRAVLRHFDEMA